MTSSQTIVRTAQAREYPHLTELYPRWGYGGGLHASDTTYVAEAAGQVIGIVRRTVEHDVMMLRGMQIDPSHRRQGVGTQLLRAFVTGVAGRECFCIPFAHLTTFYRQGGFDVVPEAGVPRFLVDRLAHYRQEGHNVMVMRRPAEPDRDRAG
jgi:N-acetylglutamate synthase-like GNAT family acetyltransferase